MGLLVCCLWGEFVDLGTATRQSEFPRRSTLLAKCNHASSCRHVLYLANEGLNSCFVALTAVEACLIRT